MVQRIDRGSLLGWAETPNGSCGAQPRSRVAAISTDRARTRARLAALQRLTEQVRRVVRFALETYTMLSQLELFPDECPTVRLSTVGASLVVEKKMLQSDDQPEQRALNLEFKVTRLVPRSRNVFLAMESTVFFRRSARLCRVAMKLQRRGVIFLGDFLRLPAPAILAAVKDNAMFIELGQELARVDLAVDDRFPWWRRPATQRAGRPGSVLSSRSNVSHSEGI